MGDVPNGLGAIEEGAEDAVNAVNAFLNMIPEAALEYEENPNADPVIPVREMIDAERMDTYLNNTPGVREAMTKAVKQSYEHAVHFYNISLAAVFEARKLSHDRHPLRARFLDIGRNLDVSLTSNNYQMLKSLIAMVATFVTDCVCLNIALEKEIMDKKAAKKGKSQG